ncbi:hypothetical protein BM1_05143 [Bipolaris maydis]|uniref:uncharacterized protein n=1 Tax=Cochliobolus heterostrophus TaxID=5016 RepID=UPI0024DACBB1|nr:hypothetical protein BM1_05143 [Bipolaris maydis]KAJ5025987.1 hypothetical protein J3E73DRAFT_370293 [Bipolaris maydis]KAJ6270198.1 hypothetical protein PSV08DRAFT_352144 [Bipolaris maydis]KAJ6283824.1 hypothetical protein J3E71DRAFT_339971 [Bipolaris maydis]
MKIPAFIFLLPVCLCTVMNNWELTLYLHNGTKLITAGYFESGCRSYKDTLTSPVKRVVMKKSPWMENFELYARADCHEPVSYQGHDGDIQIKPPSYFRSFKVY